MKEKIEQIIDSLPNQFNARQKNRRPPIGVIIGQYYRQEGNDADSPTPREIVKVAEDILIEKGYMIEENRWPENRRDGNEEISEKAGNS